MDTRGVKTELIRKYVKSNSDIENGTYNDMWNGYLGETIPAMTNRDMERQFLIENGATPANGSLADLWDSFLAHEGFTTGSIQDRMRAFFNTTDVLGFLMTETGDSLLLEDIDSYELEE